MTCGGDDARVLACFHLSIQPILQRRRGLGGVTWHQDSAASCLSVDSRAQSIELGLIVSFSRCLEPGAPPGSQVREDTMIVLAEIGHQRSTKEEVRASQAEASA